MPLLAQVSLAGSAGAGRGCLFRQCCLRVVGVVLTVGLASATCASETSTAPSSAREDCRVACDLASYGPLRPAAWSHLGKMGIKGVVLSVPEAEALPRVRDLLAKHGLKVVALRAWVDFSDDGAAGQLADSLDRCGELGAKFLLLTGHVSKEKEDVVVGVLRGAADAAEAKGVTLALSNRPELGTTIARLNRLLARVDRPNVQADFDSGAVHENQKDVDVQEALLAIVDRVATVTVADHDGKPGSGVYPVVGEGVVDVAGVLGVLKKHGYAGPLIIRLDPAGLLTADQSADEQEEQIKKAVANSMGRVMMLDMSVGRITMADYLMLAGYFVLMLGIGLYFFRQMRGMKDFFSGGNRIPWWLSGVSFYMSSFSVFAFVSYSALAYHYGWLPVTLLWVTAPATVFSVLLFARRWRRARIDSPVEYLETRYSAGFRQLIAWQGIPVKMIDDALKLVCIGSFISVSLGMPMGQSMFWSGLVILAYTFMGGLWAVTVTDFIQFVVMAVAILVLVPLAIHRLGDAEQWWRIVPRGVSDFFTAEYNVVYLVLLILLYCVAWSSVNWPLIQRYYCVANEREAIKVGWLVTLLNVVGPPLMFLPAIAAKEFLGVIPDDKQVYPLLCMELLPTGVLGLVIAAMFAATMSMLSSDYNVCAGVLTNDVYRRLLRPGASQKQLVLVGRLMTLVVGGFALGAAMLMSAFTGEQLFKYMVTLFGIVTAPVGVPMILGLLSRRVSNLAALWGWFLGIIVGLALLTWCPKKLFLEYRAADGQELFSLILEKEVVIFGGTLVVSLLATLVVTLLVPMGASEKDRVEAFHRRLATPIGQLDEDHAADAAGFSPFKVVGISILCIGAMLLGVIGAMLLGVLPRVGGWGLAFGLTLGFGLVLLVVGALMTLLSRGSA